MGLGSYYYWLLYILAFLSLNASILTNFVSSLQPNCSDQERIALLHFKHSFRIDCAFSSHSPFAYPKVNSWNLTDKEDCCAWEGVECDEETGQVIRLDLSSSCLHGSFPTNSSLFGLSHLRVINLADNHFNYSEIPSQFGYFPNLKSLNISTSAFVGQIPLDISQLSQLEILDISNSHIPTYSSLDLRLHSPTIDMLVHNLTSLKKLRLDTVDMSSSFPTVLSNLTSLNMLSLQFCNLYGELSPNLFRLPHLEALYVEGNRNLVGFIPELSWHNPLKVLVLSYTSLSGEMPPSIGKLANLEILRLDNCKFSGLLPSSISNLTTLIILALQNNNFRGDITFSLANFTNLEGLALSNLNVKPGQLFSQLPKLHKLTKLGLTGMNLDSKVLSLLANFTRLQILNLASTNLKGPFPNWLANLTQLYELQLNDNELMGQIPRWISQLDNLIFLNLGQNNFFGKFEALFSLQNLRYLWLSDTSISLPPIFERNASLIQLELLMLSGCNLTEFPQFLQLQNKLRVLLLDRNNITGSIPQWLVATTKDNLLVINLSNNNLTGFEKPTVVLPWNNLKYIDISNNKFHGQLPIPMNSMKYYLASSNLFSGNIPKHICNTTSLLSLDLSRNMLSGQIPHCIANQLSDSLETLNLESNSLTGTIPQPFTRSCKVKMINLRNNELRGRLPKSLVNCLMLEELDIGRNQVNDTFPSWLGSLPMLQVLVLNYNSFHGIIPYPESSHEFCLLRIIDISNNLHSGDLPSSYLQNWHEMEVLRENQSDTSSTNINLITQVGRFEVPYMTLLEYSITITNKGKERLYTKILKVFRVVDFSSNNFTGRIPDTIGSLQGLQALNLSNNNLHGRIPLSLVNISNLESLDLSWNMLSEEIPSVLSQLTFLEVFNVSYNQLEGLIPTGNQFNSFDNSSFQGNLRLCGKPLSKECSHVDAPQPPSQIATQDEGNKDSEYIDWMIRSFGYLSGCIIGYVIGKLFITDKYHGWFMETFGRQRLQRRVCRSPRHMR